MKAGADVVRDGTPPKAFGLAMAEQSGVLAATRYTSSVGTTPSGQPLNGSVGRAPDRTKLRATLRSPSKGMPPGLAWR